MKFMVVLICVILVLYGFYGLTVRESIVFTFLGFSISAIFAAFAGMWIIAMAATVSLLGGSMMNARIIACQWIGPYISRHFLSLNPLLVRRRRYSRGERYPSALCGCHSL